MGVVVVIAFEQVKAVFDNDFELTVDDWQITAGQHWAIIGANGSGKSALAAMFEGAGELQRGQVRGLDLVNIASVSLEQQRQLIEEQYLLDDADRSGLDNKALTISNFLV